MVVLIVDDDVLESAEEFMAVLSLPISPRVALGGLNSTSIVITDDDSKSDLECMNSKYTVSDFQT